MISFAGVDLEDCHSYTICIMEGEGICPNFCTCLTNLLLFPIAFYVFGSGFIF